MNAVQAESPPQDTVLLAPGIPLTFGACDVVSSVTGPPALPPPGASLSPSPPSAASQGLDSSQAGPLTPPCGLADPADATGSAHAPAL